MYITRDNLHITINVATPNHNPPPPPGGGAAPHPATSGRFLTPPPGSLPYHPPLSSPPSEVSSGKARTLWHGGASASRGHGVSRGHSSSLLRLRWCAMKTSGELPCISDMRRRLWLHSLIWALGCGGSWLPAPLHDG
jgi:hypothetical protein